jgi:hypothetical protein
VSGSKRDALIFNAGANDEHGLRRNYADRRRAVSLLLLDEECAKWTQLKIAEACRVSQGFVCGVKKELSFHGETIPRTGVVTVQRGGTTYEQDTTKMKGPKRRATPANPCPERDRPSGRNGPYDPKSDRKPLDQPIHHPLTWPVIPAGYGMFLSARGQYGPNGSPR